MYIISTQICTFLNTLRSFCWKEENKTGRRDNHTGLLFFRDPGCGKKRVAELVGLRNADLDPAYT